MASTGPVSSGTDSLPCSVVARRLRSKELAQKRRTTYKSIMDDLTKALPFPKDVVSQLDYNSRLRLALCFFRLKALLQSTNQTNGSKSEEMPHKSLILHKGITGLLQNFMTEALDGFLMVALADGTITYLSESIHRHLGLFQSEHIGISLYELVLQEDEESVKRAIHMAQVTAMARIGHNATAEVGFFCRMKCSRFKVTNTISKTPGYKLVYVSGTLKMAANETFLVVVVRPVSPPSILELKVEGNMFVTHYSMDMKCTFFDGRLFQLMGYNKQDLLGDVVFTLHHHDDTEATMQCSHGVMSRGEGLSGYYRFLVKHGFYLWLQTRATVMYDSRTGNPSYILCMNYVINKQKGDRSLELRNEAVSWKAASGNESIDPVINEIDSRAHDPFPLVSREDGKNVNPLEHFDKPVKLEPAVEVTSSNPDSICSDSNSKLLSVSSPGESVLPDSNSKLLSVSSPGESILPDSTSSDSDTLHPNLQMTRTNTESTNHSSDTGYISSNSFSGEHAVFSEVCEVSSFSSYSPHSDVSGPQRKSSAENHSPPYTPSVGSSRSVPGLQQSINPSPCSANDPLSIPSEYSQDRGQIMNGVSQNGAPTIQQNPQLSSLLTFNTSSAPQAHSNKIQGVNTVHPYITGHSLGKRPASGSSYIKQEASTVPAGYIPHLNHSSFMQSSAQAQQQMQSHTTASPPLSQMDPNSYTHQVGRQHAEESIHHGISYTHTPPQGNQRQLPQPTGQYQSTVYQQQKFPPDWLAETAYVKNKLSGQAISTGQQQQFQQPQSRQMFTSQSVTHAPSNFSSNTSQYTPDGFSTDLQSSLVINQPLGVQSFPSYGIPDQLPQLTGDDLKILDDLVSLSCPSTRQL